MVVSPADEALPPSLDTPPLIRAAEGLEPSGSKRCPAHTTGPSATLSPSAHFPGFAGYRTYLAPTISRRGEEGFSSCLACPCHRAVASTPPKWDSRVDQISAAHAAFALRLRARPSGTFIFEATSAFTFVTAR